MMWVKGKKGVNGTFSTEVRVLTVGKIGAKGGHS
jgi:hypothetical protein